MGLAMHPAGHVSQGRHWTPGRMAFVIVIALFVLAALAIVEANRGSDTTVTTPGQSTSPSASWTVDASEPGAFPTDRTGFAWFDYNDPMTAVTDELGEGAVRIQEPVMWGTATIHAWTPADGATLEVWSYGEPASVDEIILTITPGTPGRFALWGGLVAGSSTIGDVLAVWGEPLATEERPDGVFVRKYSTCVASEPIGVFFMSMPGAAESDLFTGVSVGLLDEPSC